MNLLNGRAARVLTVVLVAASTAACATVTRGTKQTWTVQSEPSGAAVTTTNGFHCDQTPCSFKVARKDKFEVTITKDGYKPYTGHVDHHVATAGGAAMAGNVVLGGLIGVGVDASTGAMMDLKPNPLIVNLAPVGSASESVPADNSIQAPAPK